MFNKLVHVCIVIGMPKLKGKLLFYLLLDIIKKIPLKIETFLIWEENVSVCKYRKSNLLDSNESKRTLTEWI